MTDIQNDDFIKKKRREIRERIFRDKSKYNVGKEGRLTGVTRKENVLKDKDDMDNVEDFFMSENDESSDNKEDSENEGINLKVTRKRRSITQPIVPLKENSANIKDNNKKKDEGKKGTRKVSIQTTSSTPDFENSLLDPSIFDSTNSLDQSATSPSPPPKSKLNEKQTDKTSEKQKVSKIDIVKDKGEKKTTKGVQVKLTEKEKEISNLLQRSSNKDSDDNDDTDDSKKEEEGEEKKLSRKELRRLKNGEINKPIRDRKISISLSAFLDDPPTDNLDQGDDRGQGYDDMIDNIIDFSEDRHDDEEVKAKSSKSRTKTSSKDKDQSDDDNRVNQKNKTKENKTILKKNEETVKGKKNSNNNLHYFEPPESPFPHSSRDTVAPLNDIDFENDDEDDHSKRPVNNKKNNKLKENKEIVITKKAKTAKKVNKDKKRGEKKEYDNNNVNYAADDSVLNDEDDSVLLENRLAEEEDSDFTEGNISKRVEDEELSDYENDITKDEFSVLQSDPALSTPKHLSLSQLANYKVDLNNKTTAELKNELKKIKLETTGNKGQLIDRILDHLSSQSSPSPGRSPFHSSTSSSHALKSPKYQTPNRKYPKRKTRITPLEYWKNERVVYSRNKSGLKIIKEEEDDDDHQNKSSQPKKKQKVEPLILAESQVYNVQTKSYMPFGVAKSMDMMEMEPYSEDQEDIENGVQKCEAFGFTDLKSGSIYIPPNQTTDVQKPTNEHRVFYVQQGNLEVTICKTTLKLVKGCHFFVPPGNKFEMKNTSPLHTAIVVYFNALFVI